MKFLSPTERLYILQGIQRGIRCDGRSREEFRQFSLSVDCIPQANASCRIQVQNGCDVLVGIRLDLGNPALETPNLGKIICNVDCSTSTALNEIEDRSFRDINSFLAQAVAKVVENSLNLEELCILSGHHCWLLYIDVLVLEFNGNLLDCSLKALKEALSSLKIPRVTVTAIELETDEKEASEFALEIDEDNFTQLDMSYFPRLFTFNFAEDDIWFLDANMQEELSSRERYHIAVDFLGNVASVENMGKGSLSPDALIGLIQEAKSLVLSQ